MTPLLAWFAFGARAEPPQQAPSQALVVPPVGSYDPRISLAPLVSAIEATVVTIEVEANAELSGPHLIQMLGLEPKMSEGTGFFITGNGLVLTNHHVIKDAAKITLVLSDGGRISANVLGSDPGLDVALLQATDTSKTYSYAELGDSDALAVGDWVVVMGNGFGLGVSASTGIVSGKNRSPPGVMPNRNYLQTDAAINMGNSGGPMFSLDGQVVGMSAAIMPNAYAIGFAIPSNQITPILDELRTSGRIAHGYLGVRQQTLNPELRLSLGIKTERGALLTTILAGTPAAEAGLEIGDVIVLIDGRPVSSSDEFNHQIDAHKPGDRVVLTLERDSKRQEIGVVLSERGSAASSAQQQPAADVLTTIGLSLAALPGDLASKYGISSGVLVHSVTRGSAAHGRLQPGDVIVEVDRRAVASTDDVLRVLSKVTGNTAFLAVLRGDTPQIIALPMP